MISSQLPEGRLNSKPSSPPPWYEEWFNEDYLALYAHRDLPQARQQVDALISLLRLSGHETVLDVGCGAGRHVIAFAERRFQVVGVDLSSSLLDVAKKEIVRRNIGAVVIQRDMRDLEGLGPFDLVTSFFTSFGYLATPEEDLQVLRSVHSVLRAGGTFFLDYLHPEEIRATYIPETEKVIRGETIILKCYLEDGCIVKEIHFPDRSYRERVRLYSRDALEKLCVEAGLTPLHWYNDYDWSPWAENGSRQLLIARRTV